jgi:drug/metabolite transporter (DMT)-like permease
MNEARVRLALAGPQSHATRGIALMLLSMVAFTAMDTVSKYLDIDHDGVQVAWARYFFHFWPMMIGLGLFGGRPALARAMRSRHPGIQLLRGVIFTASAALFTVALGMLPIAEATSIAFVSPLIVSVLAGPVLGERVGLSRWLAVVAGFSGVLVIAWPSGGGFAVGGALLILLSATLWAAGQVLNRRVRADDSMTTLFYTGVVGTVLLSLVAPLVWTPPDAAGWALMLVAGLLGGVAHFLFAAAFRVATAATLAPFNYTQMLWAGAGGWLVFGELPTARLLCGAAIIVAAGLCMLWHENRRGPAGVDVLT